MDNWYCGVLFAFEIRANFEGGRIFTRQSTFATSKMCMGTRCVQLLLMSIPHSSTQHLIGDSRENFIDSTKDNCANTFADVMHFIRAQMCLDRGKPQSQHAGRGWMNVAAMNFHYGYTTVTQLFTPSSASYHHTFHSVYKSPLNQYQGEYRGIFWSKCYYNTITFFLTSYSAWLQQPPHLLTYFSYLAELGKSMLNIGISLHKT